MSDTEALIIGGGPAGLMAAQALAEQGHRVLVAEAKPSLGRKFLMAGKSGLNLTKAEPFEDFLKAYEEAANSLHPMLAAFDNSAVQNWAETLGATLFTGSTGRVFPTVMKASPLLRAWLTHLSALGVRFKTNWRWTGWDDTGASLFDTPEGQVQISATATVLALGGASWKRLGSDGKWADILARDGAALTPFAPSNAGLSITWSAHMDRVLGHPLKNVAFRCGPYISRGEAVISRHGLEGGGVYTLTKAIRQGHRLIVDLLPDLSETDIAARIASASGKQTTTSKLRKKLNLSGARLALLHEIAKPLPASPDALAKTIKSLDLGHPELRPIDEAISTAGGIRFDCCNDNLMLRHRPGVFCAGEMLDWEAPTGGYLLTACFATGRFAGLRASQWLHGDTGRTQ